MNIEYVKNNEGIFVDFIGKFEHKKEKVAFSTHNLLLDDGTKIILVLRTFDDKDHIFIPANHKKSLKISGKVYVGEIPEKYGIVSRKSDPYMVELRSVELYGN